MSLLDALFLDPAPLNVWIAVRTDGIKGSATLNDPWDGSTAAKFDQRMSELPGNLPVQVNLGPGTFETAGYYDGAASNYGWQPKPAMKIVGSGIDATFLKLKVPSPAADHQYFAIGHPLATSPSSQGTQVDYFAVSDLTINCNTSENAQSVNAACGAIRVKGNHIRVRRVKVTDWGTKSTTKDGLGIALIIADPDITASSDREIAGAGLENCFAVSPYATIPTGRRVTALHVGGKDSGSTTVQAFGRSPFIRDCFVDCGAAQATSDFVALSMGSCWGGKVEGNQVYNTKFGGPCPDRLNTHDLVVVGNYYKNVQRGPSWNAAFYSGSPNLLSSAVTLQSLAATADGARATTSATTTDSHGLIVGDRVQITVTGDSSYAGIFEVSAVPQPNQFDYKKDPVPSGSPGTATWQRIYGIDRLVVEGNTLELQPQPGTGPEIPSLDVDDAGATLPRPPYVHGEIIIRANKIRYLDGQFASNNLATGVRVKGARRVVVQENALQCAPANPLKNENCETATYFNNRTPAGLLIYLS
jgi:hypothetical protein